MLFFPCEDTGLYPNRTLIRNGFVPICMRRICFFKCHLDWQSLNFILKRVQHENNKANIRFSLKIIGWAICKDILSYLPILQHSPLPDVTICPEIITLPWRQKSKYWCMCFRNNSLTVYSLCFTLVLYFKLSLYLFFPVILLRPSGLF